MEPDLDETKRLLARARDGDRDSERELFGSLEGILRGEARRHRLMTVVRRCCTDDDVVHEVWLRFYSSGSFSSFEPREPGSLRAYLAVLLDRTLLDMCRRQQAAKRDGAARTVPLEVAASDSGTSFVPVPVESKDPTPTSGARTAELRRICREVLDGHEYEIWMQIEEDGRSFADVAAALGRTSASVRGVHLRARMKLVPRLAHLWNA